MIIEYCKECDWQAEWSGGSAAKDPGIAHAYITGHTVISEKK